MSLIKRIFFYILILILTVAGPALPKNPELKAKISEILSKIPATTKVSAIVFDPLDKDTIFALNSTTAVIPASNMKLFTTVVALSLLGPNYPISTVLYSDNAPDDNGVIEGNVYIKGYGNGLFDSEDLQSLVTVLLQNGVTKITGDIYGDDSYLDNEYHRNDWLEEDENNLLIPAVSALALDHNRKFERRKVRRNRYRTVARNIENPPVFLAESFYNALQKKKIKISGTYGTAVTPDDAYEIARVSIKLQKLVSVINKRSDNFLAEILFKLVGRKSGNTENNGYYASQTIKKFLIENDIYSEGTQIADGSGLSKYNYCSAASLCGLLEWVYVNLDFYENYLTTLSVAGTDGTLGRRMSSIAPGYKFYGKTGSLKGSTSVTGFLSSVYSRDIIVSILFQYDEGSAHFYKGIQDEIIELLSASLE